VVTRTPRIALAALLAVTVALAGVAAASGSTGESKVNASVKVDTAKLGKLGQVLVTSTGHVLYMFQLDKHTKVACNSECQSMWPPLVAPSKGVAKAVGLARQSMISSDRNRYEGKRIVTYNGWPLYTYVNDGGPDVDSGQSILLNGGYWWVIRADGKPER
jgi:predicted lipoprotein with Yx(FWY)xxD motif